MGQYVRALAMAWIDTATTENEELEPIWRERAKDVLGEDLEKREEWIKELKELVIKEKDLKVPESEQFFLKFLRSGLMSPMAGLGVMQNYFSLKKNYARYFQGATDLDKMVNTVFAQKIHCMLPYRDQHGRRIYVFRPGRWDPEQIPFLDLFCVGYMLCEMVIKEERTQIAGCVSITDATGFGFKQMKAIGLEDGKNLASFFNISFPLWLRQSHILHAPRVFNMLFSVLRPFLSDSVRDNVVFHSGDLGTIRDYISGDILPSDLGGNGKMGPMENQHNVAGLRKMESFFQDIQQFGYQ